RDLAASEKQPADRIEAKLLASALRTAGLQVLVALALFNGWLAWMPPSWLPLEARKPLIVAGNLHLLSIPLRLFVQALVANFDVDFVALSASGANVLSAAASLITVRAGFGLLGLASVWGAAQLAQSALGAIRLIQKYPSIIPTWSELRDARSALGRRNVWAVT